MFILIILSCNSLLAEEPDYPKNFYIEYQRLSQGSLFHVMRSDGIRLGKVERKTGSHDELMFYTLDDKPLTRAALEKKGYITTARVSRADGEELGWFAATIYNLYPAEFKLYSKEGLLIAVGEMNWIGSAFRLYDPNNGHREFATFSRPRFKLHTDSWHVEITREGVIAPEILILIGAFQTSLNLGLEGFALQPASSP